MTIFISWLVQVVVTTTLMVPVVMITCRLIRCRPSMQHALWVLVLIKFLTPPLISLPIAVPVLFRDWAQGDSVSSALSEAIPAKQLDSPIDTEEQIVLSELANLHLVDDAITSESFLAPYAAHFEQSIWRRKVVSGVFLVWIVGAIVCTQRNVRQVRRQLRLIRKASPASDKFAEVVAEVARKLQLRPLRTSVVPGNMSPFVWCLGVPRLIWPQSMMGPEYEQTVRSIIAHELSHIRRRDHWIAWMEMSASFIWWWNPLYWFVRTQIRTTAEMACDAIALANYPDDRTVYAETLFALSVSKTRVPSLELALGAGRLSSLERRMATMMSENVSSRLSLPEFFTLALMGLVVFPAWSLAQDVTNEGEAPEVTQSAVQAGQLIAVVGTEQILRGDMAVFVAPIIERNHAHWSAAEEHKVREQLIRQTLRHYVEVKALYQEFFRDLTGIQSPKEVELTKVKFTNRVRRIFFEKQVPDLFKKYKVDTIPALEAKLKEQSMSLSSLQSQFVEQVLASELERKYVPYKFEIEREPTQVKDLPTANDTRREALSNERRNKEIRNFREQIMARTAVWTLWPSDIPGARPLVGTP